MSPAMQALAITLAVALVAAATVMAKHRFFPPDPDDEPREDVAEYISMMVGVLYALVLGLALVSVWETTDNASSHVQAEAGALHQTYLVADALPPDERSRVRAISEQYARHVVADEWPRMAARDDLGSEGWTMLDQLRTAARVPATATPAQQMAAQELLSQLGTLDEARRGREEDAQSSLSPVLWLGLILGGVLTVAFMFLFGIQRNLTHIVMVMGLAALITFLVLLIHELDAPFGGYLGTDTSAFTRYFTV
ncbi:DUF4239 domain-containing protein [Streptomyces sp. NPDC006530]|uniref:bestrophin-like domain n=1 Tax=Streptomyces sp. NPDC006530 TaxID=3364750 RepID=UPI0036B7C2B7